MVFIKKHCFTTKVFIDVFLMNIASKMVQKSEFCNIYSQLKKLQKVFILPT